MYHARIKLVYKYSESRLMMQRLSPFDLLGLGGTQGGTFIQTYHTANIICINQQLNVSTSILRLNLCCKACPQRMCWALELDKEEHINSTSVTLFNVMLDVVIFIFLLLWWSQMK